MARLAAVCLTVALSVARPAAGQARSAATQSSPIPFRISWRTSPDRFSRTKALVGEYEGTLQEVGDSIRVRIEWSSITFRDLGQPPSGRRVHRIVVGWGDTSYPGRIQRGSRDRTVSAVLPLGRSVTLPPMTLTIERPDMRRQLDPLWLVIGVGAYDADYPDQPMRIAQHYAFSPRPVLRPQRSVWSDSIHISMVIERFRSGYGVLDARVAAAEFADSAWIVLPTWSEGVYRTSRDRIERDLHVYFDTLRTWLTDLATSGGGSWYQRDIRGDAALALVNVSRNNPTPSRRSERVTLAFRFIAGGWQIVLLDASYGTASATPPP